MQTNPGQASTIIFLCVANSARSQMAEGLARATAPTGWHVFSAGSSPGMLHPLAIEVMRELNIDISAQHSKSTDDVPVNKADVIVTLCAEEVCPSIPGGAQRMHWPLPDPVGRGDQIRQQLDAFRAVRDDLKRRIEVFWSERAPRPGV